MIDIAAITATFKAAQGVVKEIGALATRARNKDVNEKVIDLQQHVLTLQTQFLELVNENNELKRRDSERERIAQIEKEVEYRESVYWRGNEGPFCPKCWDDERKLIHLNPGATKGTYGCGVCKEGYWTSKFRSGSTFQKPPAFEQL